MNSNQDLKPTIAAIATAPGDGGVAILRLSGSKSIEIANRIFSKDVLSFESHKLYLGSILDLNQKIVDKGMLVVMKAPHSFTGEDVVEIHCHGGHFLSKKILKLLNEAGASYAGPGEFTERAFLNGKMDLAQAEAVQTLIAAKNEYALKMATDQLEGGLSKKIKAMQKNLIDQAAILEAWVDFPEEGIEFTSLEEIVEALDQIRLEMESLISTYENGKALQEGFSLCLVGRPNVGKSSLMNQLLKKERAIVTPIEGTTRDTLEETFYIEGIAYRLIDTAGIRKTQEAVEKIGIERATQSIEKSDLILFVLDASQNLQEGDHELVEKLQNKNVLALWNKSDLPSSKRSSLAFKHQLNISCETGEGIEPLNQKINEILMGSMNLTDEIYLTQSRHKEALQEGLKYLKQVIRELQNNTSPEWMTFDLKSCLKSLSSVIGMDITENILSSIFSKFCIGK